MITARVIIFTTLLATISMITQPLPASSEPELVSFTFKARQEVEPEQLEALAAQLRTEKPPYFLVINRTLTCEKKDAACMRAIESAQGSDENN